jgi:hypothetical protein
VLTGITQSNVVNRTTYDRRELKECGVEALIQTRRAIPKVGTGEGEQPRFGVAAAGATGKGRASQSAVVGKCSEIERFQDS